MSQESDGRHRLGVAQLKRAIEAIATLGATGQYSPEDLDLLQDAFTEAAQAVTRAAPDRGAAMGGYARAIIGIDPNDGRLLKMTIDPWPPISGPQKCPHCDRDLP